MTKRHIVLSMLVAGAVGLGIQVADVSAQPRTQGQELERRQNQRVDDWASSQKQRAREDAEKKAGTTGVGRERQIQNREREIDRQAAQKKQEYSESRKNLPKEKMDRPYNDRSSQRGR